jgi:hypothetical protein
MAVEIALLMAPLPLLLRNGLIYRIDNISYGNYDCLSILIIYYFLVYCIVLVYNVLRRVNPLLSLEGAFSRGWSYDL